MNGAASLTASPLLLVGAAVTLAALDFVGTVFAKEWASGHNHWFLAGGLLMFGVLFIVYALSLKTAELSTVTLGWMVFLQIGLLLIERFHYGVTLPSGKWIAIAAILCLQAYLILAPNGN
jgi:hypothetical protein